MRGYIGVKFYDDGNTYTYKIPDSINPRDIGEYVIVENAFQGPSNPNRYKLVKVIWVDSENLSPLTGINPTKYIVDYVDDKPKTSKKKQPLVDTLWSLLTVEEKNNIIKSYLDVEKLY